VTCRGGKPVAAPVTLLDPWWRFPRDEGRDLRQVRVVFAILSALLDALIAGFRSRASLVVEILVLRQQLAVLKRCRPRPQLRPIDRAFWVVVSRVWSRWADALAIVKPATVVAWHRRGFARFWAWKSRCVGRPPLAPEVVALIVRMARENPLWSRRRIANELAKLGHDVGKDAVARYMPRLAVSPPQPPSPTWGTFIRTHAVGTIAVDFFTVPTVTFGVLYVFFVLSFERRRLLHVNVTEHPTAEWAAQQIVCTTGPRPRQDLRSGVRPPHREPWSDAAPNRASVPMAERVCRTMGGHRASGDRRLLDRARRAPPAPDPPSVRCLLQRGPPPYVARRRRAERRDVEPPSMGRVVAMPRLGGLHHRYGRVAA
jgi:putative transposase